MNLLLRGLVWAGKAFLSRKLWTVALSVVHDAALMFADNADRRKWAVGELQAHGMSENVARLAVELAVAEIKR